MKKSLYSTDKNDSVWNEKKKIRWSCDVNGGDYKGDDAETDARWDEMVTGEPASNTCQEPLRMLLLASLRKEKVSGS